MNKFFKRLALLLAVLMIVSMMPVQLFADNSVIVEEQSNGTGENGTGEASGNSNAVATVNGVGYTSLAEAIAAATPDANGVITYEISGKATVDSTGWIQVARAGLTGLTKVEFVGKTSDAEICITGGLAILADQNYDIDVSFEELTLSKPNPEYGGDYGHSTNYFTTWLRNTNAAENTVTYTNCTFPNGACNNQFGKTVVDGCTFSNTTAKLYNFWNYSNVLDGETTGVANTEIKNSTFTGVRGIKIYSEKTHGGEVLVSNTTFDGLTEKAAIVTSKPVAVTVKNVSVSGDKGFFTRDITGNDEVMLKVAGTGISGIFNITSDTNAEAAKEEFNISAGTFTSEVSSDYLADGFELKKNTDGTYGVKAGKYVAQIGDAKYETLAAALAAAKKKSTVTLLADTRENVTISTPYVTLDLNGFTLNGSTGERKPALTITARVTVKDGSAAQTGTIMREDTAENSGVSSHYVIDIQGDGWLTFESGTVKNNSGSAAGKGASLVRVGNDSVAKYPGLNIKGGTFTQDNFIVIKVDSGDLFLNGGTLNSANSYAIENWHRATIKGGTVNGTAAAWTYSGGHNSALTISGGTVNGNVLSVSYDGSTGKKASVSITGGTVNGELGTYTYSNGLTATEDATKATIEVTGGTFKNDPSKYVVEGSAITDNGDGTFGVAKAYLAEVDGNKYYTMDEAFKAQTASGEPIVLLRDYTTGSTFNSGTVARTVDLNGHTWTCTGKDANSAAFEINNANASLTVKNGKIVSSQLVGLIPSAMGGTIKYDNSSLTFENVEMSTTATSGIETNGNNTNDTVTLKNSTLNVPNGFGIYFPSSGTLTVENSKITAKTMGVQVCSGVLIISGADTAITVTGDAVPKTEDDGAIQDGAAISIVNRTGYKGLDTVTISGGKFTAKEGNSAIKAYDWANKTESDFTADKGTVAVSGGTFSSAVPADLCAEGLVPVANTDGTYGVKAGKYVAQIGDVKYETLADALAAANAGDTVTLLADINTPEKTYEITKSLTIDLNGKTVTGSGYDGVFEVTGKNIKVVLNATNGGKVIAVENSGSAGKYAMAVWMCGAGSTLTINGGEFTQNITSTNDKQMDMIYASAGTIIINSGSFTSGTPKWTLNINDSAYKNGTANIIVNGGTFTGYDPRNAENEGKGTSLVADGVGIDKNADGTFTAKSGMAAQIVDENGGSVAAYAGHYDAIAAAKDGEKVILLSDRKNFVTNTINANITIDLNGKTLSVGNNNPFFRTNGEVTIQNGTISSDYRCVIVNAYNKLTLKNVKITSKTDNGWNLVNVCSNAEVTIDKDTVLTATSGTGAAVFVGQEADAKYTLNVYGKVIQEAKSFAISGNGSYKGTTTINIYDGAEVKSASVAIYHPQAGVINVNGGLVEGYCAIGIKSGTLNINGGTVRGTADDHVLDDSNSTSGTIIYDGSAIVVDSRAAGYAGNVNINVTGGTVESCYSTAIREIGEQDKPNMTQLTKLNVIGGSVLGASKNPVNVTSDMLVRDISVINISVSGGTFKHAIPDSYCAEGFIPTKNADGTYGVKEGMYVAQIGDVKYETLKDAFAAAKDGDTITIVRNFTTDETKTTAADRATVTANVTLDFGSYVMTVPASLEPTDNFMAILVDGSTLTVEGTSGGIVSGDAETCGVYGFNVKGGGKLVINGGGYYCGITVAQAQLGTIEVNGGSFAVNDGSGKYPGYMFNCVDANYVAGTAGITVNGGTFVGYDPRNNTAEGTGTSFVAEGVGIDKNADGTFTAKSGMAAQIVDADGNSVAAYATLADAIAAANAGETVKLLADVTLDAAVKVPAGKNVTLDLNGKKLSTTTKTGDATRHYYAIDNYGTFTLRDSSAEQSGEIRARGIENLGTGTMTIESGKIVAIDANGGAAIWNLADLTIKGGTFEAEYVGTSNDPYGPGCVYNNGTLTINGGTFMSANKRTYAIVSKAGTVTITPADGKNVTISGAHGGLGIDGGTAIINGGSYASSDYYGLYVSNDAGTADVTVNGGTFTGKKYSVLIGSDGSSSVTSTLKIKGGTFDMPIHAQENTIDGTIAISGGKFKFKVDDKYFADKLACSATPNADGYYTVMAHPIISAGISIGEDMSFRIMVGEGYENGSLKYYYIGVNGRVEGEGTIGTDTQGNSIFRIYNVNPQRADLIYVIQYYDADGNAIGAPKEISVLTYFEGFYNMEAGKNEDVEARKTFIANFLEYCASAMERSYADFPKETLDGKTWQYRADAVRAMMTRLGLKVADYEFKGNLGRYYNDNAKGNITDRGIVFGSTFRAYYEISKDIIDSGCRVFRQGTDVTDKLVLENGAYRFYFELAPYEFKDSLTITIYNGTTKVCEYSSPLANTLKAISESTNVSASKLAKAAFNYFVALQNYEG